MRRLFWRAGFGATPGEAARWAARGKRTTIDWLLYGNRRPDLPGGLPEVDGAPLDPYNEPGHDVVWWLDRMVRSRRPLVEKMTLFWHDHFATNDGDVPLMLKQNKTLRKHSLGNFRTLTRAVTRDPAMQFFLSLADNDPAAPNENYARELMELFTLGSGYSERDIRQASRALTGFISYQVAGNLYKTRYDASYHDRGVKRVFGQRGRYDWAAIVDLCLWHPRHAGFLLRKMWDFFITTPPPPGTLRRLKRLYRRSGFELKPVLREILSHRALYANLDAPDMVKSPLVYLVGALRTTGVPLKSAAWINGLYNMGQVPFNPPSVAGWEWGTARLSTNTMQARFAVASAVLREAPIAVPDGGADPALGPAHQLSQAEAATGYPWVSSHTRTVLLALGEQILADAEPDEAARPERADMLQRTLRHFLLSGPDAQLH